MVVSVTRVIVTMIGDDASKSMVALMGGSFEDFRRLKVACCDLCEPERSLGW